MTTQEACIANISPAERRKRLVAGAIPFVFGLVILAVLVGLGVNRWWRLVLLPVYWASTIGYFQWRDKT